MSNMSKCPPIDCFVLSETALVPEPNADIGGPGVIIGFLGTAWFVVLVVILHYFFASHSTKDPFSTPPKGRQPDGGPKCGPDAEGYIWVPNHIDQLVLRTSAWFGQKLFGWFKNTKLGIWLSERPRWEHAFTKVLLGMCDVQLLTGIGILFSGYISMPCFISAYHWQLVVYLAWFSNLTHIACLTALRSYLHQHQLERNWRLFFMTVLWAGLIPAMVPTAFFNWSRLEPTSSLPGSSGRCFLDIGVGRALFNDTACFEYMRQRSDYRIIDGTGQADKNYCTTRALIDTSAVQSAIISILLLGLSYFSRVIKLTKFLSYRVRVTIRRGTSDRYIKRLAQSINKIATNPRLSIAAKRVQNLVYVKVGIALYLVAKMYADLLVSDASDVYWLIVSAVWGTLRLSEAKSSVDVDENGWSFGQVLPVFLLIGPIVLAIEAIIPQGESEQGSDASNHHSLEPGHPVVLRDDILLIRDDNARQPLSDASQRAVPINSELQVAQETRSSTENSLGELPLTATAGQPKAPENAHLSVGNMNTCHEFHVSSAQTAYINTPTPVEITPEQLRAQLYAYYADVHVMGPNMVLACLQVLPMTAVVFLFLNIPPKDLFVGNITPSITTMLLSIVPNVFLVQPVNCFMMVLLGLAKDIDSVVPTVDIDSTKDPRRPWRYKMLRLGLFTVLYGLDLVLFFLFTFAPGYIVLCDLGLLLLYCCGVGIWYAVQSLATRQWSKGPGRADTFPLVAEVGRGQEPVRVP
ncbi:hypothetical protein B0I37DRAFT_71750 [Chaetomium sp. MPI-CAGE-AT-0009]|nr:hypothetical protein B0I37DRAFT_71750 [Chaetomium sp. MPI-CAGE-AT-0009]